MYEYSNPIVGHIFVQGYVDAIPKIEQQSGDKRQQDARSFDDFECAGMGDGEGLNDVTDQIEETGQVEGLKVG